MKNDLGRILIWLAIGGIITAAALTLGKTMSKVPGISLPTISTKPTRTIEIWEDEPTRCRNWRTCKSTKFVGNEQSNGSFLWQCQLCKSMWLYPFKARMLVGITDTMITFHQLPSARQVLPTPAGAKPTPIPETSKPEPKPKKERR